MEVREERPVSWAEALAILVEKESRRELGYVQKNALDYLRKFTSIKAKAAQELAQELSVIEKLKDTHIIHIVNMLPQNEEELRQLFQHEPINISEEDGKKILSLVKKHQ